MTQTTQTRTGKGTRLAITLLVCFGCMAGVGVTVGVGGLMLLGLAAETGEVPAEIALPGGKIPPRITEQLEQMQIVQSDERVLYFYSAASLSNQNDGNLFTERRVVSYTKVRDGLAICHANYDEIEAIEFLGSEHWFVLLVSPGGGLDEDFYRKLVHTWQTANGDAAPDQDKIAAGAMERT